MTMDNVRKLMKRATQDDDLRKALNGAKDHEEREKVLKDHDLHFTHAEFDEMIDHLHTQCQTKEEADEFFNFRNWWEFLRRT